MRRFFLELYQVTLSESQDDYQRQTSFNIGHRGNLNKKKSETTCSVGTKLMEKMTNFKVDTDETTNKQNDLISQTWYS